MRVLVTGAAGRLGHFAVSALTEAGHEVHATDQRMVGDLPVRVEPANLLDRYAVYSLVRDCQAVVHLGNYPAMNPHVPRQQLYSENVTMNANVFIAAVETGIRQIVFASSIQAFTGRAGGAGDPPQPATVAYLPLDGELPRRAGNVYGLSKVAGEQLLQHLCEVQGDLDGTVIRFPALFDADRSNRWRHRREQDFVDGTRVDEGFSYLMMPDAGELFPAVLGHPRPGYRQMFPAANDNLLRREPRELIERFYEGVPLRKDLNGSGGLVDTSRITEQVGWKPRHVLPAAE